MNLSDGVTAWIRTAVPAAVGAVAAWLAKRWGVHLDTTGAVASFTAGAMAIYYAIASSLERQWPAFGFLLGTTRGPATYTGTAPVEGPAAVPPTVRVTFPPGTEIKIPDAPPPPPTQWTVTIGPDGQPTITPATPVLPEVHA